MPIETDDQLNERLINDIKAGRYLISKAMAQSLGIIEVMGEEGGRKYGHEPADDPETDNGYDHGKYRKKPYNIWFYYQRMNTDGTLYVAEYIYNSRTEISNGQMKSKVRDLAINARLPLNQQNPRPSMFNYSSIEIKRISYFVIFVDEANWEFHKVNEKPVVLFKATDPNTGDPCDPNFSFFRADTFKTTMPVSSGGSDRRESLVMVNLLKKSLGGDELAYDAQGKSEKSRWFFDFPQRVRFATPDRMDENGDFIVVEGVEHPRLTVIFDPGGNNLGPPDPPPA